MLVRIPKAKLQHLSSAILALLLLSHSSFIAAQTLHRFGQSIQPIYEGFERNDDGTFTMWFGYLNRNYGQTEQSVEMFKRAGKPTDLILLSDIDHFPFSDEESRFVEILKGWLDRHFPATIS